MDEQICFDISLLDIEGHGLQYEILGGFLQ